MNILGISCFYHDAAAALIQDGNLIAAAEEERFSRKKHDYGFPDLAVDFCLQKGGIKVDDLDYVVFHEKPLIKFERILMTVLGAYPKTSTVFREAMVAWFNEKLWIKGRILKKLNLPQDRILFSEHHMSHAASALFCSSFEAAAIMTVDGVGEWTTTTLGKGRVDWKGGGENWIQTAIGLFAQPKNLLSPSYLWMLRDILTFNQQSVADHAAGKLAGLTMREYFRRNHFTIGALRIH